MCAWYASGGEQKPAWEILIESNPRMPELLERQSILLEGLKEPEKYDAVGERTLAQNQLKIFTQVACGFLQVGFEKMFVS